MRILASTTAPVNDSVELHRNVLLSGAVGLSVAGVTTLLRLAVRLWRRPRLAWDDAFAIIAMLLLILTGVVGKIYYSLNDRSITPQQSRVALYYIFAITFDLVIWTSRLSILSTIMMFGFYKRILRIMAALFGLAATILVAQVLWVCEPQHKINHWKDAPYPQCALGDGVAITQITTDVFADIVLVVSPLLILRHLRSEEAKAERLRLSVSFAVGGLTTVVSIVHAYYLFNGDLVSLIVSNVELSVSVIICNFTVLAAALHRFWKKLAAAPSLSSASSSRKKGKQQQDLTISLEFAPAPRPNKALVGEGDAEKDEESVNSVLDWRVNSTNSDSNTNVTMMPGDSVRRT